MRRPSAAAVVALLLVLAGCSVGYKAAPADGDAVATPTPTPPPDGTTPTPAAPADPATDVLGWENGYWHNESITIDRSDGLNATERDALVARSTARVEYIRQLEFREQVPIRIVSRAQYRTQFATRTGNASRSFRAFDNAKFEALFLIGEDADSLAVQQSNRGANVLGFYSPKNDSIVIVSDAPSPTIDRSTLAHELVHALQDQYTDLLEANQSTRERYNAVNGLIEGEANLVQQEYERRCADGAWDCIDPPDPGGSDGNTSLHLGVYVLNYFPYSEGPWFVKHYRSAGGWDRVTALYEDPPASTAQVIAPERYGEPAPSVALRDANSGEWQRLRPEREGVARADYASLGQSAMVAMFAYTLYDEYNRSYVVGPREFLNVENGEVNRTRPFNYAIDAAAGWDGDRMHVYWQPDAADPVNRTAYVWKSEWVTEADAREFAAAYRALLAHWGGERVGDHTWRIADGPYADAFHVRVEGSTVVIVNAPTRDDLAAVRSGTGS